MSLKRLEHSVVGNPGLGVCVEPLLVRLGRYLFPGRCRILLPSFTFIRTEEEGCRCETGRKKGGGGEPFKASGSFLQTHTKLLKSALVLRRERRQK